MLSKYFRNRILGNLFGGQSIKTKQKNKSMSLILASYAEKRVQSEKQNQRRLEKQDMAVDVAPLRTECNLEFRANGQLSGWLLRRYKQGLFLSGNNVCSLYSNNVKPSLGR